MHTVIMFESGHFQRKTTNIPLYKFDIYPHAKKMNPQYTTFYFIVVNCVMILKVTYLMLIEVCFFPQNTCLYLVNSTYSKAGLIISINFVENQRKLPYITKNIMK